MMRPKKKRGVLQVLKTGEGENENEGGDTPEQMPNNPRIIVKQVN